ncbi:MAG: Ig-like domain-containing protein, partial [Bacteroidota bacterium]|nr:Ig-like domain-containing protein [Bacteroidota bacterium]
MKKLVTLHLLFVVLFFGSLYSCKQKSKSDQVIRIMEVDPGFSTYIEEYSSGIIPVNSTFKVKLTRAVATSFENKKESIDLAKMFSIEPSIKGECTYSDGTFTFKPKENLKEGTEYIITFFLKRVMDVPAKYEKLKFNTFTLKRNFSVSVKGLKPGSAEQVNQYSLHGEILTSVPLKPENVEQIIEAEQEGKELTVQWDHQTGENRHLFTVINIQRKDKTSTVDLSWNGKVVNVNEKGEKQIEIPAIHVFKLMNTNVIHEPEQQVKLTFSDPIDTQQDLEGLVELKGTGPSEIAVEGNQLTLYLHERLVGEYMLVIDKNIKNTNGQSLPDGIETMIDFQLLKPALRLPGRGVIMPDNGSVIFPFEAVNLKAVDLRIVKIFPSNMINFLQDRSLSDTYDMKRVGKLIYSKRIDLVTSEFVNFNKWNAFSIDLSKHINIEKGAVYQVEIGMQKAYSVYVCSESPDKEEVELYDSNNALENEKDYWENP